MCGIRVELSLILQKVGCHDKVLNETKENVPRINELNFSQFIYLQLLGIQLDHVMSNLFPTNKD